MRRTTQFSGVRRASRPTFVNVCMIYFLSLKWLSATSLQPLSDKQAHRVQCLCGRLDRCDDCDKSMWHAHPHIKPGIDTSGNSALDVSSRVIEQHFVVAGVNANGRQP